MDFGRFDQPITWSGAAPKPKEEERKKPGGVKGLLASALPTIGGAIGAVGGSFIAPVAGTAAGGAGGAAVGELLRQRLMGESPNAGRLATEVALGAVPGVLKGVKGAVQGAKAISEGGEQAAKRGLLKRVANNQTKAGSGLQVGGGVGDINRVDEAAEAFQRMGITGTPEKQLRKINDVMKAKGSEVDTILAKNPIKLDGNAVKARVAQAIDDPTTYAELDLATPAATKALTAHLDKFAKATTAKEINDYIKVLNPIASKAQDKLARGAALTAKENAALAAKKAGDDVLKEYPEIAPLKKDMAILFERNPQVAKESTKTSGIPILGIKSKAVKQTGDAIRTKAGSLGSVAAKDRPLLKAVVQQGATRVAASPFTAEPIDQGDSVPISQSTADMTNDTTMMPASNSSMDALNTRGADSASMSGEPDMMPQIDQAIQQALANGDTKGLNNLLAVAEYYQSRQKASAASKPLSAEAAKVVSNAQTGISALTDFNSLIEQDPSAFSRTNIPGVGILDKVTAGRASGALGTSGLNAARQQVIDIIARLRTGAAITNDEAARFEQFVPQPGDPPEVRAQKTQYLMQQFQMVADRSGSAGTDLQQATGL